MRKFLFILGFFFVVLPVRATDLYIAQTATGGSTGADCGDALPYTFFNNSANWPSPIGPGTTVHLCGTFTAAAGTSKYLVTQGNGSSGSPITIRFENGAIIQAPYWSGPVIQIYNSFITVDGGANGTIQATANGTRLANQQDNAIGVNLVDASDVLVENLTVANLYVHACTLPITTCTDETGGGTLGITAAGGSNIQFMNNTVHDVHWAIGYGARMGAITSNIQSGPGNNAYNTDHGVFVGDNSGSPTVTGIYIYGNHFHDFASWDDHKDGFHHDGIHVFINNQGSDLAQVYVYNNLIDGNWGQDNTAAIFMAGNRDSIAPCGVFNNVMNRQGGQNADGALYDLSLNGCLVANNTVFEDSYSAEITASVGAVFYNNVGISQSIAINGQDGGKISASDFNDLYTSGSAGALTFIAPGGVCCINGLATWIANTGYDTHTITANPNLTAGYVPNPGSAVIAAGKNLSSICGGQSNPGLGALCFDAAGNARSSTANWDIGAYSASNVAAPAPPANLTVTLQ